MKIITEPSVYLVGQSAVNDAELDRFLADHDVSSWTTDTEVGGEKLVEVAGRTCYMSFAKPRPGGNKAYIDHILEVSHGSVCEHAVFNLLITGVSRSLTHELVRHRAGMGYSQLSQRFVDESDTDFVVPPLYQEGVEFFEGWEQQEEFADRYESLKARFDAMGEEGEILFDIGQIWVEEMKGMREVYSRIAGLTDRLLLLRGHADATARRKAAREAARSVLPNATETKIFVTGNARALRHFVEMRGDIGADAEIRRLAVAVLKVLREASPNLFGDYVLNQSNGEPWIDTPHRKV